MLWPMLLLHSAIVQAGDRVLLMGDSEAYLLGYEFPALAEASAVNFKAVAVPGSSVLSWPREYKPQWSEIRTFRPDVILVSLGANDACLTLPVIRREPPYLAELATKLNGIGAREVIWLGPPKIGNADKLTRAISGLEEFAVMVQQQTPFPYLDAREIKVSMWEDALHCSRPFPESGCATWAMWAWSRLTEPHYTIIWTPFGPN